MSAHASGWGGGYVTDVPYIPGYYRHQSPLRLNLACLIGGVAGLHLDPGAVPTPRLGWNTWIPAPEGPPFGVRRADAADAMFEAEIIEAEELAGKGRQ